MRDINDYTAQYIQYIKNGFEDYQVKYRRRKVLEFVERDMPKSILEIGCGMEPFFQFIDIGSVVDYTVIEPSPVFYNHLVEVARNRKNIRTINEFFGGCGELVDKLGQYEMIICSGLLNEVENPIELLNDMKCVSTKDTIIHINVPNANSVHRLLAKCMGLIKDEHDFSNRNIQYQQHNVWNMRELEELLRAEGFDVVEKGSYFIKPFTHDQMYEMMRQKIIDEKVLDGLFLLGEQDTQLLGSEIYINCKIGDT